jgi:hypothetical protein
MVDGWAGSLPPGWRYRVTAAEVNVADVPVLR